jgi:DNA-binding MarR family transcriptional regulator
MVRDGLIKKTPDPNQKNSHLLSITPEGERLLRLDKQAKAMKKIYSKLSDEQLHQLDSLLQTLDEIAKKELSLLQKKSDYVGGDLYYD